MNPDEKPDAITKLESIPRLKLGHYPTPIEELSRLRETIRAEAGTCPRLFIKRDDYTGAGFGGNKVRKLEYVLAQAIADGAQVVITTGGEKSNHARATAMLCARLGLRCILVMNPATAGTVPPGFQPASLFVDTLSGAEIRRISGRAEREPTVREITTQLQASGTRSYEIPLGASTPLGALGFVRAIQETTAQCASLGIQPYYIVHASSSAGTQAGIVTGCQLFGWDTVQVIGVSPDDPSESIAADVLKIAQGACKLLGVTAPSDWLAKLCVLDEYVGSGYGIATPESTEALQLLARTEGVVLDPVYTAKALAGLLDQIRRGTMTDEETVLFWHTGGQLALFFTPEE
jgi:L-cysteate sulfo-lyase